MVMSYHTYRFRYSAVAYIEELAKICAKYRNKLAVQMETNPLVSSLSVYISTLQVTFKETSRFKRTQKWATEEYPKYFKTKIATVSLANNACPESEKPSDKLASMLSP